MSYQGILTEANYQFLMKLKLSNEFWYLGVIGCAKRKPTDLKKCFADIKKNLPHFRFDESQLNLFQICKAANKGLLEIDKFATDADNSQWLLFREATKNQMILDKYLKV